MTRWTEAQERLALRAPDVVAAWRALDAGPMAFRRELRRRAGAGSASAILAQLEAVADALAEGLAAAPEETLRAPGGEEDWTVAQTFAHATAARRWLPHAAALEARGDWPEHPPQVRPGVPGPADASRELLLTYLDKSRRAMADSAAAIDGHETLPCRLDHPLVGRLRCGEWLLFAGVHDLMHLEQLHRLLDDA